MLDRPRWLERIRKPDRLNPFDHRARRLGALRGPPQVEDRGDAQFLDEGFLCLRGGGCGEDAGTVDYAGAQDDGEDGGGVVVGAEIAEVEEAGDGDEGGFGDDRGDEVGGDFGADIDLQKALEVFLGVHGGCIRSGG